MFCKKCGCQMSDEHMVCQQCGTPKGEGNSFCDGCGSVITVGNSFCTGCGKKIEVKTAVSANEAFNSTPYSQQTPAQQFKSQAQQANDQYLPQKKYCMNCGAEVLSSQPFCPKCNTKVGNGNNFCINCGAAVQPGAATCTQCGKSIKQPFDVSGYFNEFGDNIANVFKTPNKVQMLIDHFSNFVSVLIFIIMFLPIVTVSVSIWNYSESESLNAFGTSGLAGFLLFISVLTAFMRYEPFSKKFIASQPQLSKYYMFVTPGLQFISLVIIIISFFNGVAAAADSYGLASVNFTFFGWLLILLIVASVADTVYLCLKQNNIIK